MSNLMPSDLVDAVEQILRDAAYGDGARPNFLTSYQVFDRLPKETQTRLISERTLGGLGSGVKYSAMTVVSQAADLVPGVVKEYLDSRGIQVWIAGQWITPGYEVSSLYRIEI